VRTSGGASDQAHRELLPNAANTQCVGELLFYACRNEIRLESEMSGSARSVQILLRGAQVTPAFRSAVFDVANRAGMTVNEFVLCAAGEKLRQLGRDFPSVFPGYPDERLPEDQSSVAVETGAHR
jgi:hypothetical protein